MINSDYFREKARQCRDLVKVAGLPEVKDQLEVWAREFEERAASAERILGARRSKRDPGVA
jgi:hypothetical protein